MWNFYVVLQGLLLPCGPHPLLKKETGGQVLAMKIIFLNASLFSQGSAYSVGNYETKGSFFLVDSRVLQSMEQTFHGFEEEKGRDRSRESVFLKMSLRNAQRINENVFTADLKKTWYLESQKISKQFLISMSDFDVQLWPIFYCLPKFSNS